MFSPNHKFIKPFFQSIFILVFSLLLVNCGGGDDSDGDNNLETDILNGSFGTVTFNTTSTGIPLTTFTPESYSEDIDGVMTWGFIVGGETLGSTVYSILISPTDGVLVFSEAVIGGEARSWQGSSADVIISADSVDFNNAALLHSLVTTSDFTIVGTLTRGDPDTTTTPETPTTGSGILVTLSFI